MNLYLIEQHVNRGYDTYDSAVVVAKDKKSASQISPGSSVTWTTPENVIVTLIGKASKNFKENAVICSSFNAG